MDSCYFNAVFILTIAFNCSAVQFNQASNQRPRSFSLNGQLTTQIGSMVGASSCQADWITIPCATNSGRTMQMGIFFYKPDADA
jgi:hypothetical protein